jgi:hypothetical protein
MYDWCKKFSEDREEVSNRLHGHIQQTDATDTAICHIEELNLEKK